MVLIPSISFVENNTGTAPIDPSVRNRIGIVGTFSRGPTYPTITTGNTYFQYTYGADTSTGSVAYQVASDQGATNFCLCRVLGNPQAASGQVTFAGTAAAANTLFFNLRFIGTAQLVTNIQETITTTGTYTGSVSGRYWFKVTAITSGVATISYVFIPLGGSETNINYSSGTTFTLNLSTAQGITHSIANGLSVTFAETGDTSPININLNDVFKVRVTAFTYSIPINQGDIPYQIATSFTSAISGVLPIGEVSLTNTQDGVIFSLNAAKTDLVGSIGNLFAYSFELLNTEDTSISLSPALGTYTFMAGGVDGPRQAYQDFYAVDGTPLLRIIALYPGQYGNNISVTIYPDSNSSFRLSVNDLNASNYNPPLAGESYTLNFTNLSASGVLNQTLQSNYIQAIFLPMYNNPTGYNTFYLNQAPVRLAAPISTVTDPTNPAYPGHYGPAYLSNITLSDGYDGPTPQNSDYISAINQMVPMPIHMILCPGIYDNPAIEQALINHAESSTEQQGLRIAILNTAPFLLPNGCQQETTGLDSERGVIVAGWSTYAAQNVARFSTSPDAIYAGKLGYIPFYASPSSRTTSGPAVNIIEVDLASNSDSISLQLYTTAKIDPLHLDPTTQAFFFTSGVTLSSDPNWQRIYIRRTYDIIRMDLFDLLGGYIGEPQTALLQKQIVSAINNYMSGLLTNGQIANYGSVTCDNTNNSPANYIANQLNISLDFLPLYSVEYITITLTRNTGTGLTSLSS